MVIMLLYSAILFDFVWHYSKQRSVRQLRMRKTKDLVIVPEGSIAPAVEHRVKILLAALLFADLLVFVRSVYRVIELLGKLRGRTCLEIRADATQMKRGGMVQSSPMFVPVRSSQAIKLTT